MNRHAGAEASVAGMSCQFDQEDHAGSTITPYLSGSGNASSMYFKSKLQIYTFIICVRVLSSLIPP